MSQVIYVLKKHEKGWGGASLVVCVSTDFNDIKKYLLNDYDPSAYINYALCVWSNAEELADFWFTAHLELYSMEGTQFFKTYLGHIGASIQKTIQDIKEVLSVKTKTFNKKRENENEND